MKIKDLLKITGISLIGVLGVGLSIFSSARGMTLIADNYSKLSAYSVNENNNSVTFSKEELNNCGYSYLATPLNAQNYPTEIEELEVYYNGIYGAFVEIIANEYMVISVGDDYTIHFELENNSGKFYLLDSNDNDLPWQYPLQVISSYFADNMAKQTTLTASESNNNTYEFFATYVNDDAVINDFTSSYIIYNNEIFNLADFTNGDELAYSNSDNSLYISFKLDDSNTDLYSKWVYWNDGLDSYQPFTNSITIYSTYIADNLYAPNQPTNLLQAIVSLLTGGIVGLSGGIGSGVSTLTTQIFISNNALSVFGGMIVVFAGISLAIGLCRWIMQFLTSLGAKK